MSAPVGSRDDLLAEVRDLSISFPDGTGGRRAVVQGVSFSVRRGEVLGIVGESGSGKSISVRPLVGLAGPSALVSAGTLRVAGADLRGFGPRQWRDLRGRKVGLVLQDALVSLDPLRTVDAEVEEAVRAHSGIRAASARARVVELLWSVGIPDPQLRARQYSHELSGGLRQRALIASAIAADPDLIIADEPTTALDAAIRLQILDLLKARVEAGAGLIVISHDIGVIERVADRIVVMRRGEVVEDGATRDVLRRPQHPYTRRLLRDVPSGASRGFRLSLPEQQAVGAFVPPRLRLPERDAVRREVVLSVEGVHKAFRNADGTLRRGARDIGFDLHRGETVGLVGESGSGKSTVARIIMGLTRPDAGRVLLEGLPWSEDDERGRRGRRRLIQTVTQDTLGVFDPRHSVRSSLLEAITETRDLPVAGRDAEMLRLLDAVALPRLHLDKPLRALSGGERQRVAIARALATDPRILVCDEPVSALDASVQAQVLDLLWELQAEFGLAYLFISHDLGVIHHMSDRILVMRDGEIVEEGDARAVFETPRHAYVVELVNSVARPPRTLLDA